MLTPLALLYFLGLPIGGAVAAVWALLASGRRTPSEGHTSGGLGGHDFVMISVPLTLPIFGFLLLILYAGPSMDSALVEVGARAYAIPALMVGCAMAIILWRGGPVARETPMVFGRVLVMAVLPETGAIFALLVSILILGRGTDSGLASGPTEAAGRAALYIVLAGLGALIEAILIVTGWDFRTPERFSRVLVRAVTAEPLMLIGLFLAINSLAGTG